MTLFQPNATYISNIENGLNYLNCPKYMFNETLHQLVRGQGELAVLGFLLGIHYPQAHKAAQAAMDTFKNVTPQTLRKENPNSYTNLPLSALPTQCQKTDAKLNKRFEQPKAKWDWFHWARGIKFNPEIHR
jgi:hypothetical protein